MLIHSSGVKLGVLFECILTKCSEPELSIMDCFVEGFEDLLLGRIKSPPR